MKIDLFSESHVVKHLMLSRLGQLTKFGKFIVVAFN